jgi:sugar (pentulose or hexulose) kinase
VARSKSLNLLAQANVGVAAGRSYLVGQLTGMGVPQPAARGPGQALERKAAEAPPGANGLSFLPYLSGERTPLWSPWASGAMLGLRLSSRPADLARAVFEGLAFSVGHIADVMRE